MMKPMKPNQPPPTDAALATSGQSVAARALRAQDMPEPPGWMDAQILSAAQTEAKVIRDKIAREVPVTRRPWFRFGLPALAAATVLVTAYLPQVDVTPSGVRLPEVAQAPAPKTAGAVVVPSPAAPVPQSSPPANVASADLASQAVTGGYQSGTLEARKNAAKTQPGAGEKQSGQDRAVDSQMPPPAAGKPAASSAALAERKRDSVAPADQAAITSEQAALADKSARSSVASAPAGVLPAPDAAKVAPKQQEKLAGLMEAPPPAASVSPAPAAPLPAAPAPAAESAGTVAAAPPAMEPRAAAAPLAKKDQNAAASGARRESSESESVTRNFSMARAPAVRDQAEIAGIAGSNTSNGAAGAMPSQAPAKNADKQSPSEAQVREYMAIRALMMENKLDEARERLQRLIRAQPDLVLPADLKALQRSAPAQQTTPQPFPAPSP